MRVITNKPILEGKSFEQYHGPDETTTFGPLAPTTPPTPKSLADVVPTTRQATSSEKRLITADKLKAGLDKAKNVYQTGKDSGIFDTIGQLFGKKKKEELPPVVVATNEEPKKDDTMKYVLIGGGVLALGIIVYLATKGKSSKG